MNNYWAFKTYIIYTVSYTMSFYDKTSLLLSLKRNDSVDPTISDLAMTGFTMQEKLPITPNLDQLSTDKYGPNFLGHFTRISASQVLVSCWLIYKNYCPSVTT